MIRSVKRQQNHPNFQVKRDADSAPMMSGYAALFEVVTDLYYCTESIARGAFKESIQRGDDVRALFNHKPSLILGRTPKTLTLSEDDKGLFCRISPPDTQLGRDLLVSMERGDITQMSFGFNILDENVDWHEEKPHFTILEAALFDVSPVTFPAYNSTEISVTRGAPDYDLESEVKARLANLKSPAIGKAAADLRTRRMSLLKMRVVPG